MILQYFIHLDAPHITFYGFACISFTLDLHISPLSVRMYGVWFCGPNSVASNRHKKTGDHWMLTSLRNILTQRWITKTEVHQNQPDRIIRTVKTKCLFCPMAKSEWLTTTRRPNTNSPISCNESIFMHGNCVEIFVN